MYLLNRKRWFQALFLVVTGILWPIVSTSASQIALPASPPYSWGTFGLGLVISPITVQQYVNLDGTAGGSVLNFSSPVYAPTAGAPELIGTSNFEFALWKGSATGGAAGTTNRYGAVLFGGFDLTAADVGTNFSFLQIYTDASSPTGTIDGGGYAGKVNSQIPRYGSTPGWDFAGTQYDFFDVPFDQPGNPNETVLFETALVSYTANTVQILGDYTWSFTTGANGNPQSFLTGTAVTQQALASTTLLNLYSNANPGVTYLQIAVPEPASVVFFGVAIVSLMTRRRRRFSHEVEVVHAP